MKAGIDLGAAADLLDAGAGVRFEVRIDGQIQPAFVVRHQGAIRAYLNRCAHVAMELDWSPGQFFDAEGHWLICSTHGALYDPDTGRCAGGACLGRGGLLPLAVEEEGGRLIWRPAPGQSPV